MHHSSVHWVWIPPSQHLKNHHIIFHNKIKPCLSANLLEHSRISISSVFLRSFFLHSLGLWQFLGAYIVPRKGMMGLGLSLQWTSVLYGQVTPLWPYACCEVPATENLSLAIAFKTWLLKSIIQKHSTFLPHSGDYWLALGLCHSQKYSKLLFLSSLSCLSSLLIAVFNKDIW